MKEQRQHSALNGREFATGELDNPTGVAPGAGGWWAARCRCGKWLTKFDFDRRGAVDCALDALTREHRRCA